MNRCSRFVYEPFLLRRETIMQCQRVALVLDNDTGSRVGNHRELLSHSVVELCQPRHFRRPSGDHAKLRAVSANRRQLEWGEDAIELTNESATYEGKRAVR